MTAADAVTVAVPTRGRPQQLRRILRALAALHDPGVPWRVLVVDNSADPAGATGAAAVASDVDLPVGVVIVHESRPGVSAARNRAVRDAGTPWIALLDDDVVPEPDWLARLVAAVRRATFDAAGGKVVLDPAARLARWMDASLAGFVTALDLGPEPRLLTDGEYVLTANAIFPTDVLRRLGFDPRLGPRPGSHLTNDDLDLVRRARADGVRVGWAPDAVVVHDAPAERLTLTWLARRAYLQGRSDRRLHAGEAAGARLGGLRGGWWHLRARVRHWWRTRRRSGAWATFAAHVLAETAWAVGFWRESLASRFGRGG